MFDKLVESNAAEAEFTSRGRYFMVSAVVVGVLFLAAVTLSLYAADIDIGDAGFDLTRLVAPEVVEAPEPERPTPPDEQRSAATSDRIIRVQNIARTDEPQFIPDQVSATPSKYKARPYGRFELGAIDSPPAAVPAGPQSSGVGVGPSGRSSASTLDDRDEGQRTTPPPPVSEPKKKVVVSLGPVTGRAKSLPQPPYPAAALSLGIQGTVTVQIMIDEQGNVVSAKAVDGHIMFRTVAEQAAKRAKFDPTLLSNQPVKATGIISYNFKKN